MSATAHLTATFVPLLSPPLRISVQSLRWLTRRPPLVRSSSPPCRTLHLYKTARTKTINGMHKILAYKPYGPPELAQSNHKINLVKDVENSEGVKVRETVAENLTLEQLYADYIEPGKMLRLATTLPRTDAPPNKDALERRQSAQKYRDYVVFEAYSSGERAQIGNKTAKNVRGNPEEIAHMLGLREIKIQLGTPHRHYEQMLDKAFQFIQLGCMVEFDICVRHCTDKQAEKLFQESTPLASLNYVLQHFPHLRPDFIAKSMPKGTRWVVEPFSNDRHVSFVLGLGTEKEAFRMGNLTKRVLNVQKAVMQSVQEGKLAMELPKGFKSGPAPKGPKEGHAQFSVPSPTGRGVQDHPLKKDTDGTANEAESQSNAPAEISGGDKASQSEPEPDPYGALRLIQESERKRPTEADVDHSPRFSTKGNFYLNPAVKENFRRSALDDIQASAHARLEREDARVVSRSRPFSYARDRTSEIPEEKRHLWEAWTAGGRHNDSRFLAQTKKEATKQRDKELRARKRGSR